MAKFDVYRDSTSSGYLLDCQTDLLSTLNTRLVVPLRAMYESPKPAARLNPVFEIGGEPLVMVTQYAASVPVSELRIKVDRGWMVWDKSNEGQETYSKLERLYPKDQADAGAGRKRNAA